MGGIGFLIGGALQGAGAGMLEQGKQEALDRRAQALAKMRASQPFTIGRDRLRQNPDTSEVETMYEGKQDFEEYADALGLEPGTADYRQAAQDYVLRSNGPSALQYDEQLDDHRTDNRIEVEGARQTNRVQLEGVRQKNRSTLEEQRQGNRQEARQTPTYRDLNPPEPRAAAPTRRPLRMSQPSRPFATGPNGQRMEYNGKAWVLVR